MTRLPTLVKTTVMVTATLLVLTGASFAARAAETLPRQLEGVGVEEHLGAVIDLDLVFTSSDGQAMPLRALFRDHKPVLLTLNSDRLIQDAGHHAVDSRKIAGENDPLTTDGHDQLLDGGDSLTGHS